VTVLAEPLMLVETQPGDATDGPLTNR
jgi:hypothetical protein